MSSCTDEPLTSSWRELVLSWGTGIDVSTPQATLDELCAAAVLRSPDADAVVYHGNRLTFGELDAQANQLAHRLRDLGVGPEVCVGVCLRRTPFLVVALLAVLKAGGAYVPVDPAHPQERLAGLLADVQARVCVTETQLCDRLPAGPWHVVRAEDDRSWLPKTAPSRLAAPEHLAYVLFTSGSTGRPKGVCVEHRCVVDFVVQNAAAYGVDETTRMLAMANLGFDVSVAELFTALVSGATLVIADDDDRLSAERLQALLRSERITVAELPPSLLALLDPTDLPDLRLVSVGGEAPSARMVARWVLAGHEVVNAYGPTETTVTATLMRASAQEQPTVPIGRPMANHRIYVLDQTGRLTPPQVAGELYIAGAGVARGYLGRADLTAERFLPDPFVQAPGQRMYRTGDRAAWNSDGTLEFLGRVDDQLNIRGFRVEPGEVETQLRRHPGVADAAVAVCGADPADARLVGYVVSAPDAALRQTELESWCRATLPSYLVPTAFVVMPRLPLTTTGKVDRSALPAPGPRVAERRTAARSPLERAVLEVWKELLPGTDLGVHDDFFDVGGHSLIAMRLLSRLRRSLGVDLSAHTLYATRTVAGLAAVIAAESGVDAASGLPLRRRARRGELPLSYAQQRLWFVDQLAPGRPTYNLPVALRLRGPLDAAALQRALGDVVTRHPALRTYLPSVQGQPAPRLMAAGPVELPVTDLSHVAQDAREAALARRVQDDVLAPLALHQGPLWRARLIRLAEDDWAFVLVVHHIVADGWSLSIILDDLGAHYRAHLTGSPVASLLLRIEYGDYAEWQRARLDSPMLAEQLDFWRNTLAGAPPAFQLPTDRPRPAVQTHVAGQVRTRVPEELVSALRAVGAQQGVTLFTSLVTVFQLLLGRLAGVDDVVVACPVAGRSEPELESIVGLFVDMVPLRTDLSGDPTFPELLRRVGGVVLDAFSHQDVPFDRVVEALRPSRDPSRSPLAQVGFNLLSYPPERLTLPGITVAEISVEPPGSLLDLTLYARDSGGEFVFEVVYNRDLFDRGRVEALLDEYLHLLQQAVSDGAARVATWSLVTPSSARLLPYPRQPLSAAAGPTVLQRFRAQAQADPSGISVQGPDRTWTYHELDQASDLVAARLADAGIGRGAVVAIPAVRDTRLAVAMLGVLKAGSAFSLLDAAYPPARLVDMLRTAPPDAWLAVDDVAQAPALTAHLEHLGLACRTTVTDAIEDAVGCQPARREDRLDDAAHVLYTSGSTGSPHAVLATHRPLAHFVDWYVGEFGITSTDRFSVASGVAHDPVLRDLFVPLCVGATACVPPSDVHRAPDRLLRWLRVERVTVLHLTPQLGRLLSQAAQAAARSGEPSQLPDLRLVVSGGDLLRTSDVLGLTALAPAAHVVSFYGATETPQAMGWQPADVAGDADRAQLPLGRAIPDVQLLVRTKEGALAGIGELGEICVRTAHLAQGYLGEGNLTAGRFRADEEGGRSYHTGDFGRYLPDGRVEFAGRRDSQVKVRGFRVEPAEVLEALESHPDVKQALVVPQPEQGGGQRLVAYLVGVPGRPRPGDDLHRYLRSRLPEYALPSAVIPLDRVPLTLNGKVDFRALPTPQSQPVPATAHRPPRTPVEQTIASVWRDVLGVASVGTNDNFFDVGGSSLRLVEVQIRIQAALGCQLSVIDLFQYPTIRALAAHLDESETTTPEPTMRRIETRRALRLRRKTHEPQKTYESQTSREQETA